VETKNALHHSGDEMQTEQMNVCQLFAQVPFKMATNSSYRMFKLHSQKKKVHQAEHPERERLSFSFLLKNSPMPCKNSFAPGKKTTSPLGTALASRRD